MMTSARVVETSVITVQKQSFSRTTLTRTIKLHYYKVNTIAKALGFLDELYPHALHVLKRIPAQLAHFFGHFIGFIAQKTSKSRGKERLLDTQPSTFLN